MVVLKAKHAADQLRMQAQLLEEVERPTSSWLSDTRELLDQVFHHRKDLASKHATLWRQDAAVSKHAYERSLVEVIQALSPKDEIRFSESPVLVLTSLGILLLFAMAGGTWIWYEFFLKK